MSLGGHANLTLYCWVKSQNGVECYLALDATNSDSHNLADIEEEVYGLNPKQVDSLVGELKPFFDLGVPEHLKFGALTTVEELSRPRREETAERARQLLEYMVDYSALKNPNKQLLLKNTSIVVTSRQVEYLFPDDIDVQRSRYALDLEALITAKNQNLAESTELSCLDSLMSWVCGPECS